ncbi:MAG: glycosyltransferase family 9 protein [Bryobacteraceae bacterium]
MPLISLAASGDQPLAQEASRALFGILAEGLADRFAPELVETYGRIFSHAIALAHPEMDPCRLQERYRAVRQIRAFHESDPRVREVVVLSRITLGADIAVTSVLLDAAKRRFPHARIRFAAPEKNWRLFSADPKLEWLPVSYGRLATMRERLAAGRALTPHLNRPGTIVLDPDSRLTQLGLLPVCPEENYYLFDSRSYGGNGADPLPLLASRWVCEVLGIPGCSTYVAPSESPKTPPVPFVMVNLGVGENPRKRLPDPFEPELLRGLAAIGMPLLVDLGGSEEEEVRVRRAVDRSGARARQVQLWRGSFAALAACISRSRLYVGYDSGGQHAAAAAGKPLVTVFAGFPSERMLARWTPWGPGPKEIVRADSGSPSEILERTLAAARRLIRDPGA